MGNLEQIVRRNTLAIPVLSFIIGILEAKYSESPWWIGLIFLGIGSITYLVLISKAQFAQQLFSIRRLHWLWLAFLFCGAGFLTMAFHRPEQIPDEMLNQNVAIDGVVKSIEERSTGQRIIVDVARLVTDRGEISNFTNLQLLLPAINGNLRTDDYISFNGIITKIECSQNSFNDNYVISLQNKGLLYECFLPSRIVNTGTSPSLAGIAFKCREKIEIAIDYTPMSQDLRRFLISILLGDKEYLEPKLRNSFASTGIAHILALSGMHVAIIAGIFLVILLPLNFTGQYKFRFFLSALLVWLYAILSGLPPSCQRAAIMYSFFTAQIILERKSNTFNSLFGASIIILLISPTAIFDLGFQLSFICVGTLLCFMDILNPFERGANNRWYGIASIILASLVATASSWVVTANYFGTIPAAFFIPNLICVPLLPYFLSISLIYIILYNLGLHLTWLENLLSNSFHKLLIILEQIGNSSQLDIHIPDYTMYLWLISVILIAIWLHFHHKLILTAAILSMLSSIAIAILIPKKISDGSFIVASDMSDIYLTVKEGSTERKIETPRYSITSLSINKINILVIDTDPLAPENKPPKNIQSYQPHLIVIGGGYKGNIESLIKTYGNNHWILHPSINRRNEDLYIQKIKSLGGSYHSIRQNAPFRVINGELPSYKTDPKN